MKVNFKATAQWTEVANRWWERKLEWYYRRATEQQIGYSICSAREIMLKTFTYFIRLRHISPRTLSIQTFSQHHNIYIIRTYFMYAYIVLYAYNMTRVLKISIKNFKGFRNVRKSIETSDDISVATLTHRILRGSEVLNPVEWTQGHSARDLGLVVQIPPRVLVYDWDL